MSLKGVKIDRGILASDGSTPIVVFINDDQERSSFGDTLRASPMSGAAIGSL
jgi:hypothetical protein